ncbi:hypothetical protein DB88DRAFT_444478 [Papiliotrema laurentii]|uniref:Uncharacterized protein n=1 Tax=Papiliotrema laurentii TaxID=5418 RepID=A0AAD9FMZ4_PAPLA|nr:hypothetical protein DB88DRAFT_444478 [Papiliotrema laurentii]
MDLTILRIECELDPAPMFCGQVTVYSPVKQFGASTTAKRVSIDCAEGLGHPAILFAKAMGVDVQSISHSSHKKADADVI